MICSKVRLGCGMFGSGGGGMRKGSMVGSGMLESVRRRGKLEI